MWLTMFWRGLLHPRVHEGLPHLPTRLYGFTIMKATISVFTAFSISISRSHIHDTSVLLTASGSYLLNNLFFVTNEWLDFIIKSLSVHQMLIRNCLIYDATNWALFSCSVKWLVVRDWSRNSPLHETLEVHYRGQRNMPPFPSWKIQESIPVSLRLNSVKGEKYDVLAFFNSFDLLVAYDFPISTQFPANSSTFLS